MDDLEEKIAQVLNDPNQMAQIMAIAGSLGLKPPEKQTAEPPLSMPPQMAAMLEQAGKMEQRQETLLRALKPFLSPGRQERIDKAMQVARLSHLADYALRNRDR